MHGRLTGAMTIGTLEGIADGVYQQAADDNAVIGAFGEGVKFGTSVGTGYFTGPWGGAAAGAVTGWGIDQVTELAGTSPEEAREQIASLTDDKVDENQERMNTPGTEAQLNAILEADTSLSEADRQVLLDNYYERYWDGVKWTAQGYTE